jgi:4'-phosphopantetheinyl transferase
MPLAECCSVAEPIYEPYGPFGRQSRVSEDKLILARMEWCIPPRELTLGKNEIHVWRAFLHAEEDAHGQLEATLSADERARAARFRFDSDRKHFIAARGILRSLLGRYLHERPGEIQFCYGPQGKPALRWQDSNPPVHFNLSHSHDLVLLAFSDTREVGIDLERLRPHFAAEEIAERFFAPPEVAEFRALPAELRVEGFFLCWTRKEAYIKAKSGGLQIPLDSFRVSLTPGQPERLQSEDCSRWSIRSFEPTPGFVSTLVVEGKQWQLRGWQWEPHTDPVAAMPKNSTTG